MNNSLLLYKQKVEELIDELNKYSYSLNQCIIVQTQETIEIAIHCGLPEDIARYYLQNYFTQNEADVQDVIQYIHNVCLPYLNDIVYHLDSALTIGNEIVDTTISFDTIVNDKPTTANEVLPIAQYVQKDEAFKRNNKIIEKKLGIKQGSPMTIAEADMQKANPNFSPKYLADSNGDLYLYNGWVYTTKDLRKIPAHIRCDKKNVVRCKKNPNYQRMYGVNCATCAAAYVLRLRGFDVVAKGNPEIVENRNTWLSKCHSFDIWENIDGTAPTPISFQHWMKEQKIDYMTSNDYRLFFEENCKEKGVYIVTTSWHKGGAHTTILQREADGVLYYIEPQIYNCYKTQDGKRNINDLIIHMALIQPPEKGVMRVDDKLFKIEYTDLFEVQS